MKFMRRNAFEYIFRGCPNDSRDVETPAELGADTRRAIGGDRRRDGVVSVDNKMKAGDKSGESRGLDESRGAR
ncbi:hypothetical protein [Burkholderia plantarii]|uniref:hypothetical protein n=1 Tax=Burkholderia plantarii TaxID=41899 RepID=UPI000F505BD2|nr:hypothetical protein [Burkholderia plantarii]